ncbi:MAG: hypothetical protein Q8L14_27680 [Myxococcales bacterium]|nr:hypothetical protein [Myxococcales bacterium]
MKRFLIPGLFLFASCSLLVKENPWSIHDHARQLGKVHCSRAPGAEEAYLEVMATDGGVSRAACEVTLRFVGGRVSSSEVATFAIDSRRYLLVAGWGVLFLGGDGPKSVWECRRRPEDDFAKALEVVVGDSESCSGVRAFAGQGDAK